ncbi:MAG: SUMF1/EgtB/PvdO family nonheme iron enzyme [Chitinivibrionales bacterium]|nr:SUMF1/EgtB/PvdO family nonheme iron enzyme [Chitinivibrionales bacterium]
MQRSDKRHTTKRILAATACAACLLVMCARLTDDDGVLPFDPSKGEGAVINAAPKAISLQHRLGDPSTLASFRVWNEGDATLDLSLETVGATWLQVSPGSYLFPAPTIDGPNDTLTVAISYPLTELAPSATPYEAIIRLLGTNAVTDSVIVRLYVIDTAVSGNTPVYVRPDTLRLTYIDGGPAPVESLRVWTGAAANTTIRLEPDAASSWMLADGLLAVPADDTVAAAVSADVSQLTSVDSVYSGRLVVSGSGADPYRDTCTVLLRTISSPAGMVLVPARDSVFEMGSTLRLTERPPHNVQFTYDFWVDSTEVTQASYDSLVGLNPSSAIGMQLPVENVTWFDAALYCNARSKRDGLDTVYEYLGLTSGVPGDGSVLTGLTVHMDRFGYRLPTEAEWEYAAKGGLDGTFPWGNAVAADTIDKYVWFFDNSGDQTHPVATKAPNPFNLYDIGGNVWEWCNDRWRDNYDGAMGVDPYVALTIVDTVLVRGGFYGSDWYASLSPVEFRTTTRSSDYPGDRYASVGFRCVLPKRISAYWQ